MCNRDVFFLLPGGEDLGVGDRVSFAARLHEHGLLQGTAVCRMAPAGGAAPWAGRPSAAAAERARSLAAGGRQAMSALSECSPEDFASLAWSVSSLGCGSPPLRDAIASAARPRMSQLASVEPQALASLAWSFAVLKIEHPPLMAAIASSAIPKISAFESQQLANLAWAVEELRCDSEPLRASISAASIATRAEPPSSAGEQQKPRQPPQQPQQQRAQGPGERQIQAFQGQGGWKRRAATILGRCEKHAWRLEACLPEMRPQELLFTVWSDALLRFSNQPLFDSIASSSRNRISHFSHQRLATSAWSYAIWKCMNTPLFDAPAAASIKTLNHEESKHELSQTAWAFAFRQYMNETLRSAISSAALRRLSESQSQSLANLAWSEAQLWYFDETLLTAISAQALRTIQSFRVQEWSGTAWAIAVCYIRAIPLLTAISASAIRKIGALEEQFIANSAWASAQFQFLHPPFLDALSSASIRRIHSFGAQTLSNIARSLWVLTAHDGPWILLSHDPQVSGQKGPSGRTSAQPQETSYVVTGVTDQRFEGRIAYLAPGEDFGFITCPELHARYRRDVWAPGDALLNFRVGDEISFGVLFKKEGYPQAMDVEKAAGAQARARPGAGPAGPSGTAPARPAAAVHVDEEVLARHGYAVHTVGNPGDGVTCPQQGDRVCVSYVGRVVGTGKVFDDVKSFSFTFGVGAVIAGWDRGMAEMSLGQEACLTVHHSHAYGERGAPAPRPIPPYANLSYDVTLLGIESDGRHAPGVPLDFPPDWDPATEDAPDDGAYTQSGRAAPGYGNLSIESWLLIVDEKGGLLRYKDVLMREYDTVDQIVCVYTRTKKDGSTHLEPEFFEDMAVSKLAHQRLFRQWFEG